MTFRRWQFLVIAVAMVALISTPAWAQARKDDPRRRA